jgi:hypothetical protein
MVEGGAGCRVYGAELGMGGLQRQQRLTWTGVGQSWVLQHHMTANLVLT